MDTVFATAFALGIISALSLPLGALTAMVWRPDDRVAAVLMAFGGGALLAALTIDLVASSLETGHFNPLAVGAVLGGLLFIGLNHVVNDYGGFLRKASTTIYHLRRRQHQRIRQIARQMKRVDLFHNLGTRDYKVIAASIRTERFRPGTPIYRAGDPSDAVYIVADGVVEMLDPSRDMHVVERLGQYDVFGWKACIVGAPTGYSAVALGKVTLWIIPKRTLDSLVLNSHIFLQVVHRLLRSDEILDYLQTHQGMPLEQAERWLNHAAQSLNKRGSVPPALEVERRAEAFIACHERVRRFPLVHGLPPDELALLAGHLLYKRHAAGETLYHQRDGADRLYFIEQGEVQLLNPAESRTRPQVLGDGDAFGTLSCLTGALRSSTAMIARDAGVWELRRCDLDELLVRAPEFARRTRDYLQTHAIRDYLGKRHHFDPDRAARWARSAVKGIEAGKPMPAAADASLEIHENKGAPLAIWLGITLDGIPESLVIGASLVESHVSYSLIAGLFLSNYPEALSSSTGMRQQGMGFPRILTMWVSLMLFTGLGAALGSQFFVDAGPTAFALVEGLAAGAMLTMIAETMLPEAYFKGGSVVGMSTLMGFLVAIFFKTLE